MLDMKKKTVIVGVNAPDILGSRNAVKINSEKFLSDVNAYVRLMIFSQLDQSMTIAATERAVISEVDTVRSTAIVTINTPDILGFFNHGGKKFVSVTMLNQCKLNIVNAVTKKVVNIVFDMKKNTVIVSVRAPDSFQSSNTRMSNCKRSHSNITFRLMIFSQRNQRTTFTAAKTVVVNEVNRLRDTMIVIVAAPDILGSFTADGKKPGSVTMFNQCRLNTADTTTKRIVVREFEKMKNTVTVSVNVPDILGSSNVVMTNFESLLSDVNTCVSEMMFSQWSIRSAATMSRVMVSNSHILMVSTDLCCQSAWVGSGRVLARQLADPDDFDVFWILQSGKFLK
ncbi:uncharacterized protein LOC114146403 [Xiphophorus couchianus]|uniref:uncharacterized protein LOC114146403 n=1 Tax=Xiphophorus couchianus TaxID=32473 RepID=UPI001015D3B3|nr:uncharacterized protein LOC114146403 [Xiphophorus couchianus]